MDPVHLNTIIFLWRNARGFSAEKVGFFFLESQRKWLMAPQGLPKINVDAGMSRHENEEALALLFAETVKVNILVHPLHAMKGSSIRRFWKRMLVVKPFI